jgi:hypothetical protein
VLRTIKTRIILLLTLLASTAAIAQTTATNFTAADCDGGSHTLFTELEAGKVIVLVWIEPCGGCISDAKDGYDAAHSFASLYPGRVQYWLVDDVGNTSCDTMSSWARANGIEPLNIAMFGNGGNIIDEMNYGGQGMPHVVVLGGTGHLIYYNQISGSYDRNAIASAINNALAGTAAVAPVAIEGAGLGIFPNPAKGKCSVNFETKTAMPVSIVIYNALGTKVATEELGIQSVGRHTVGLANRLSNGTYLLKLTSGSTAAVARFTVAN